mgnify:CR=1 FL=1
MMKDFFRKTARAYAGRIQETLLGETGRDQRGEKYILCPLLAA